MAEYPCGCGGSNENCCFCFGSGFVHKNQPARQMSQPDSQAPKIDPKRLKELRRFLDPRFVNPLAAPPVTGEGRLGARRSADQDNPFAVSFQDQPAAKSADSIKIPPVAERCVSDIAPLLIVGITLRHSSLRHKDREVCRYCFRLISLDGGLAAHLMRCTSLPRTINLSELKQSVQGSQQPNIHPATGNIACPKCGAPFAFEIDLRSHINKKGCSTRQGMIQVSGVVSKKASPNRRHRRRDSAKLLKCLWCPATVKSSNLNRHMKKVHGQDSRPFEKSHRRENNRDHNLGSANKIVNATVLPADHSSKDVFEQTVSIDRRDRTRGYGQAFRENGRFGSHPMHDGFDDESGPE